MNYQENIKEARFISRPNRFIARVEADGEELTVHVKNTGRCRELLVDGARVYLAMSDRSYRRTPADLIAVEKVTDRGTLLINMDSQLPNAMVREWLEGGGIFGQGSAVYPERTYGSSRFDFYVENGSRRAFIEVKGVTLENNGIASFPDAPTERGVKHLYELVKARGEGYECYVFFVVQMRGVSLFRPNYVTDPAFAEALSYAHNNGVRVLCYDSLVTPSGAEINTPVPIEL